MLGKSAYEKTRLFDRLKRPSVIDAEREPYASLPVKGRKAVALTLTTVLLAAAENKFRDSQTYGLDKINFA
jgi:hypothetical protein